MTRGQQARAYFHEGYSCAQCLAKTFADKINIPEEEFIRMCSSFGGGMGRLREVCGAVSVPLLIIGSLYGYSGPETGSKKAEHYARVQKFAGLFTEKFGTINCAELLGRSKHAETPVPDARTAEYYDSRPCPAIIEYAADMLEQYIDSLG